MSAVLDRPTFDAKMSAAIEAKNRLSLEIESLKKTLGDALVSGDQAETDRIRALIAERERALDNAIITILWLQTHLPDLEKSEAAGRLEVIGERRRELRQNRERLHSDALSRLRKAVDVVVEIRRAFDEDAVLASESRYLACLTECELPEIEAYPKMDFEAFGAETQRLREQVTGGSAPGVLDWTSKRVQLQQERRKQEQARRRNGKR